MTSERWCWPTNRRPRRTWQTVAPSSDGSARSEADLIRLVPQAVELALWEPVGEWVVMEPVEMFDSALAGTDRQAGARLTVTVEPGTYQVRTAHVEPDPETAMVITQLVPAAPGPQ